LWAACDSVRREEFVDVLDRSDSREWHRNEEEVEILLEEVV